MNTERTEVLNINVPFDALPIESGAFRGQA